MFAHYDDERLIDGTPDEVWAVITDPAALASLDDRLELTSSIGTPGTVGSTWEMGFKIGRRRMCIGAVVTESVMAKQYAYDASIDGRAAGCQVGTLLEVGDQTRLLWSVTSKHGWGVPGFLVRSFGRRELRRWLESVDCEVQRRQTSA